MFDLLSPMMAFVIGAAIILAFMLLLLPVGKKMRAVVAPITAKPLMNKSELRLFHILRQITADTLPAEHKVMSQVSYGEFLKCNDNSTRATFNSKRADFVIIDAATNPVAVIESQGSGHYGSSAKSRENAEKRDRTKRGVLSRAGIPMIEVPAKFTAQSVRQLMETALPQGTQAGSDAKSA